jgi:HD domain
MAVIYRTEAFLPLVATPAMAEGEGMTTDLPVDDAPARAALARPGGALAERAITLVTSIESPPVAGHSFRSFFFARALAVHRRAEPGRDYDPDLLFLACVLHDTGLTGPGDRGQRFEIDGADLAAEFLTAEGLPADQVDQVWDAIALHTSPGLAERRSTLCDLTRSGIGIDFGRGAGVVPEAWAAAIHRAYPRHGMERALVDLIVGQAEGRPEKAPPYTIADQLLRERADGPGATRLERTLEVSPWSSYA